MKFYILSFCILFSTTGFTQNKAKALPKNAVTKTAMQSPQLRNLSDSVSYIIGASIARSVKSDVKDVNTNILMTAMQDVFNNKKLIMNEASFDSIMNMYSKKAAQEASQTTITTGENFLNNNKNRPEVITTSSGLQYEVLRKGSGKSPTSNDTVTCHYRGTLIDGTEFDASYNRNEPFTFQLTNVIKGWIEGIQLMNIGAKYKFYIPYQLAYGLRGAPPTIPGGAALIFEVELLDIKTDK